MTQHECLCKLCSILEHKFNVNVSKLNKEDFEKSLLDVLPQFSSIEYVYFILEIEKNFKITFPVERLEDNYMVSLMDFACMIEETTC